MAHLLFIDESGQDHGQSPYEVLAGVSVRDRDVWPLVQAMRASEIDHFRVRFTLGEGEIKAKKLLKTKTFRLAAQEAEMPPSERRGLARQCLEGGSTAGRRQITALAQAKIAYAHTVFDICQQFHCRLFASVIADSRRVDLPRDFLRKDYTYLLERFYYYLEDTDPEASGLVVFDELEKSRSHLLLDQMDRYFTRTLKGKERSVLVIPEPFFVHSELTTGIQIADLLAYVLSWGFRTGPLAKPKRVELSRLVDMACSMRHRAEGRMDDDAVVWSFAVIRDLQGGYQQLEKEKAM